MKEFSVLDMIGRGVGKRGHKAAVPYEDITLDIGEIHTARENRYSMEDIDELATGILMTGGVQEPMVVTEENGKYILVSGHRRKEALQKLIEEGHEDMREVPCRVRKGKPEEIPEVIRRIEILCGNTFNRKMTDFDLMMQAREWKEVLTEAKKEGVFRPEGGKRIRDYVAAVLGESTGKIGQLEAVNANAVPEVKEQLKKGNMGITAAYETSRLPEEKQEEIAERAAAGEDVRSGEIREIAKREEEKKKAEKEKEKQRKQEVSDCDTEREDKENARKLHVLKMLEKYYSYISAEELGILEGILEDCRRRKREYSLDEDCGQTI